MKFSFVVGNEKHRVDFSFNQFWGNLAISVDGIPHTRDFRMFSTGLVKRYELWVGEAERHRVIIEKERTLMFAGARKQNYRVFVDDRLVHEYQGF